MRWFANIQYIVVNSTLTAVTAIYKGGFDVTQFFGFHALDVFYFG